MSKLTRLAKSFTYAFRGLIKAFYEEQNLRLQTIIGIIILIIGFFLQIKPLEWCFVIIAIFLVILMEMLNSAVERVVDVLKPRIHEYVKEIKDIMAGAVLLSSILAITIGLIIFLPYLLKFYLDAQIS